MLIYIILRINKRSYLSALNFFELYPRHVPRKETTALMNVFLEPTV